MRLFFDDISGKTELYDITDCHWFPEAEQCAVEAVTVSLSATRQDPVTILLEGELNSRCKFLCDRCGESYEGNLNSRFVYLATTKAEAIAEEGEQECSEKDALTLYLLEPIIDVDELLREQAWLAIPQKNVCSEDCKGICAGCGVVLNKEPCRCEFDINDSPFAVLKKLKKNS